MLKMSTARSTTQTIDASRRVSVQMEQGDCSVSEPQISQNLIFSRALRMVSARFFTEGESACAKCNAMRSAERGPMPGNLPRAAMSVAMESGRGISTETGQVQSGGDFTHLRIGDVLGLVQRLVGRRQN